MTILDTNEYPITSRSADGTRPRQARPVPRPAPTVSEETIEVRLTLAPDTTVEFGDDDRLTVRSPRQPRTFDDAQRELDFWRTLAGQGLADSAYKKELAVRSPSERLQLFSRVQTLVGQSDIHYRLLADGQPLATRIVISAYYRPSPIQPAGRYSLSRFAYCRASSGGLLLESPRCHAQIRLHDFRGPALLASLAESTSRESSSAVPGLSDPARQALINFLAEAGFLVSLDEQGESAESRDDTLRQWEFHDLLFHSRSRKGRHANPVGGTYRFRDTIDPQPPLKPPMSAAIIPLFQPCLEEIEASDPPFTRVLESRRSLRTTRQTPLTLKQLGELLYRAARVQQLDEAAGVSRRPSPSGGGLHELELYVAARRCQGLAAGLYHYAPHQHHLEQLDVNPDHVARLIDDAAKAQGAGDKPGVVLLISARFQRVSWKYSGLAYSLILKNVGALLQTLYLVATAMGRAPCALGTGDSDLFARMTGTEYEVEGTVGEFAIR